MAQNVFLCPILSPNSIKCGLLTAAQAIFLAATAPISNWWWLPLLEIGSSGWLVSAVPGSIHEGFHRLNSNTWTGKYNNIPVFQCNADNEYSNIIIYSAKKSSANAPRFPQTSLLNQQRLIACMAIVTADCCLAKATHQINEVWDGLLWNVSPLLLQSNYRLRKVCRGTYGHTDSSSSQKCSIGSRSGHQEGQSWMSTS